MSTSFQCVVLLFVRVWLPALCLASPSSFLCHYLEIISPAHIGCSDSENPELLGHQRDQGEAIVCALQKLQPITSCSPDDRFQPRVFSIFFTVFEHIKENQVCASLGSISRTYVSRLAAAGTREKQRKPWNSSQRALIKCPTKDRVDRCKMQPLLANQFSSETTHAGSMALVSPLSAAVDTWDSQFFSHPISLQGPWIPALHVS